MSLSPIHLHCPPCLAAICQELIEWFPGTFHCIYDCILLPFNVLYVYHFSFSFNYTSLSVCAYLGPPVCRFLFALYLLRMVIFGAALFIAARPDLDNPGCYRNGWDYARGVFEGISFIYFLYKGYDEISEMIQ